MTVPPITRFIFAIGTRAQLIKMAPVIRACEQRSLDVVLIMTGQHMETIEDLLSEFDIATKPEWIASGRERATVFSLFTWLPTAFIGLVRRFRTSVAGTPGAAVLVHGDTLSTLLAALAARVARATVVHIESGLTSGQLLNPFPEEAFRRLVFRMTQVAMCPTAEAAQHMRAMGCPTVVDTGGNTIEDSVRLVGAQGSDSPSSDLVVSIHRFQNVFDKRRLAYLEGLIAQLGKHHVVHFILHPTTRVRLAGSGGIERLAKVPGVRLMARLPYGSFLRLAAGSACVLTDGGSNQEELAVLGVPTIVMRPFTERPDGIGRNAVMEQDVPSGIGQFISSGEYLRLRTPPVSVSKGSPAERIVDALLA